MDVLDKLAERIKEIKAARPEVVFKRFSCEPNAYRALTEAVSFNYQGVPVVMTEDDYSRGRKITIELEEVLWL